MLASPISPGYEWRERDLDQIVTDFLDILDQIVTNILDIFYILPLFLLFLLFRVLSSHVDIVNYATENISVYFRHRLCSQTVQVYSTRIYSTFCNSTSTVRTLKRAHGAPYSIPSR